MWDSQPTHTQRIGHKEAPTALLLEGALQVWSPGLLRLEPPGRPCSCPRLFTDPREEPRPQLGPCSLPPLDAPRGSALRVLQAALVDDDRTTAEIPGMPVKLGGCCSVCGFRTLR